MVWKGNLRITQDTELEDGDKKEVCLVKEDRMRRGRVDGKIRKRTEAPYRKNKSKPKVQKEMKTNGTDISKKCT
jgi:hypothetical protein